MTTALATSFDEVEHRAVPLHEYLSFTLEGESYGVDILRVQEIKGWAPVTRVPNAPEHVFGVLNLRGAIIPVVDLRRRFGLEPVEPSATAVVIVLRVQGVGRSRIMGMVVDAVSDVFDVREQEIQPPPDFGAVEGTEFISGITTTGQSTLMLLDVDRLLIMEEESGTQDSEYL